MGRALYDEIGDGYASYRQPDPTIAAAIHAALGDARSVLNVGAGTGSYEPLDREVVAVEPSVVMIDQRPADAAPAVQASADRLPFADDSFDAAMAIFSDHHWPDRDAGLRELRRVARRRVVIVNADPGDAERFWLTTDYLPGFLRLIPARHRTPGTWEADLTHTLGPLRRIPLPIPHDCADGFYGAYWRRPEQYLDPAARTAISVFSQLGTEEVAGAMARLRDDLTSGRWHDRHASLLDRPALDLGYAILVADASAVTPSTSSTSSSSGHGGDTSVSVRSLVSADVTFLERMMLVAGFRPDCEHPVDAAQRPHVRRFLDGWGRRGDVGVIAIDPRRTPLGAAWARVMDQPLVRDGQGAPVAELAIAVEEHARNGGVGHALLDALAEAATAAGHRELSLQVSPSNPAHRLYLRCGFEPTEEGPHGLIMRRRLI